MVFENFSEFFPLKNNGLDETAKLWKAFKDTYNQGGRLFFNFFKVNGLPKVSLPTLMTLFSPRFH